MEVWLRSFDYALRTFFRLSNIMDRPERYSVIGGSSAHNWFRNTLMFGLFGILIFLTILALIRNFITFYHSFYLQCLADNFLPFKYISFLFLNFLINDKNKIDCLVTRFKKFFAILTFKVVKFPIFI